MSKVTSPNPFYEHTTQGKRIVYSETPEGEILREVWDIERHFPKRTSIDKVATEVFDDVPAHCRPREWNRKKAIVWLESNGFKIISYRTGVVSFDTSRFAKVKKEAEERRLKEEALDRRWKETEERLGINRSRGVFGIFITTKFLKNFFLMSYTSRIIKELVVFHCW